MLSEEDAGSRPRRALILRTSLKALFTGTLLIALYYVLPMDGVFNTHTWLFLILCLAVFAAVLVWRVRGISRSEYPGLRAVEALAVVVPLYILGFAATYFLAGRADSTYFNVPLTRTGALYFSMTVFSSVGFGDIIAKAEAAQLIVTVQMFLDLVVLGFGARVFLSAVNLARQRRKAESG